MNNPNEILCYDKCELGRVSGKFAADMRKVLIPAIPMTRGVAEGYNQNTQQSGIIFVLNEEATANHKEYDKERKEKQAENKIRKSEDAKSLINSVFDTLLKNKGSETNEPTVKELKAKCEEKGYIKSEWNTLPKAALIEYLKSKEE